MVRQGGVCPSGTCRTSCATIPICSAAEVMSMLFCPVKPLPGRVGHSRRGTVQIRLRSPPHAVGQDPLDLWMVVHRVLLVARAEVEDAALSAREGDAGTEHLSAGKGADEDQVVRVRDVEQFAVHLLLRDNDG